MYHINKIWVIVYLYPSSNYYYAIKVNMRLIDDEDIPEKFNNFKIDDVMLYTTDYFITIRFDTKSVRGSLEDGHKFIIYPKVLLLTELY